MSVISLSPSFAESSRSLPQWVTRLQAIAQKNECLRQSVESGVPGCPVNVALSKIGLSEDGLPIYLVKISSPNSSGNKPKRVFVVAGQHGDEPAGPEGMLDLISEFATSVAPRTEMNVRETELYIVPVANPDGLSSGCRLTSNYSNLNRDWHSRHTLEARAIWSWIKKLSPSVLFDLHENTPADRVGAYVALTRPKAGSASTSIISRKFRQNGYAIPVKSSSISGSGLLHEEFSRVYVRPGCLVETKYWSNPESGLEGRGAVHLTAVMSVVKALVPTDVKIIDQMSMQANSAKVAKAVDNAVRMASSALDKTSIKMEIAKNTNANTSAKQVAGIAPDNTSNATDMAQTVKATDTAVRIAQNALDKTSRAIEIANNTNKISNATQVAIITPDKTPAVKDVVNYSKLVSVDTQVAKVPKQTDNFVQSAKITSNTVSNAAHVKTAKLVDNSAMLFRRAKLGDLQGVRQLLTENIKLISAIDKNGATALHYAAEAGNIEIIDLLLESGAYVAATKKDGVTPLHVAVALGKFEAAERLLAKGADPSIKDKKGRTALSIADKIQRGDISELLTSKT